MAALAGLCVLLGLGAPLGVALVSPAVGQLTGEPVATTAAVQPIMAAIAFGGGLILAVALALAGLRGWLLRGRTVAEGTTWDCGYAAPTARMQYTASSFAWPIIDMFRWILRPRLRVDAEEGDFPRRMDLASHTDDLFLRRLFAPLFRSVESLSRRLQCLQQGRNQLYVLYIAIVVIVLLLLLKAR